MSFGALGPVVWVFGAMTIALVAATFWSLVLRRRGPYVPLESKLNIAAMLIAVAFPVVGMAGTVLGLTRSFDAVGQVSAEHKQKLLSEGISQAMNATAFGLGLAFPAGLLAVVMLITGAKRVPKKQPNPGSR
ncbi:MAG: MotA/TolQ/ExbB proton channel family protein [Myxococcaceae bacterium]